MLSCWASDAIKQSALPQKRLEAKGDFDKNEPIPDKRVNISLWRRVSRGLNNANYSL